MNIQYDSFLSLSLDLVFNNKNMYKTSITTYLKDPIHEKNMKEKFKKRIIAENRDRKIYSIIEGIKYIPLEIIWEDSEEYKKYLSDIEQK
jgi:hypothetical protein